MGTSLLRLSGQRALVTGGAKGIGAAIARRLCAEGAAVTIADMDAAAARMLADECGVQWHAMDVCRVESVAALVRDDGPFQVIVNNAGVDQHAFFINTSESEWAHLIDVNLKSVLAVTHAVLPGMRAAGYGRIVNIGSEAGRLGSRGGSVYAATKGALIAFTRSIAREVGRDGITANVVAPGPVDTPLLRAAVQRGGERLMSSMVQATLVGRLGLPDEVAAAVAFLASPEAGFISGEVLGVSGGMGCGA
ncbi:SDR family NAD(P)-dependent oxidoreductase [Cupriavidus lacunae]|uniref:3-oxoacyl-ACP reductase n=1 Tax=Cupriavidus lacunae TaxID=2666307 RepID=A0A370NJW1_9BURK|nr:SDR family NAD(P)-dependent oxidoreductase [Cupriavidus lacunae]RDK05858.1 3-oxoacyl-ACP reductase [Cupriavidus lacunae]